MSYPEWICKKLRPVRGRSEERRVGKECVKAQTKQSLENVKAVLAEAGCTMEDVFKTTVFIKDMNDFAAINEVYATYFTGDVLPARSCVEVARLPKDVKVEIEVIAMKK